MTTPAGWYPDPQADGQQRYWDGNAWTQHQAPLVQAEQPTAAPVWTAPQQSAYSQSEAVTAKQKKPFWRRTWVLVTAAAVVVFGVIGAASGNSDTTDPSAGGQHHGTAHRDKSADPQTSPSPAVTQAADPSPSPTKKPEPTKTTKPKPSFTVSQEQAIGSAQDYLNFQGFSRAGLIQQLSSRYGDGFSQADAVFAVNHVTVDWNAQAVRSAKEYLSTAHFSRAGLIQQLSSKYGDGYTLAQATFGANHVGL